MVARFAVAFVLLSGVAAAADLAAAQSAKTAADKNASDCLNNLKQYATRTNSFSGKGDQAALALRIENMAKAENNKQVAEAESKYKSKLAVLQAAVNSAPASQTEAEFSKHKEEVYRAAKVARNASHQLSHAKRGEGHSMRKHVDQMERASKAQLRQLQKAAKQAGHTALRASKALMHAQMEAGVSEDRAEDDYGKTENFYDDWGEDLGGNTEDHIENFYQAVGQRVEERRDTLSDEDDRTHEEQDESIDRMRDAAMRNLQDRFHPAGAWAVQLTAASQNPSAPAAALLGLVAFGVGSSAVIAWGRRQTAIREVPLLG